jgi:CRISPR system Cascade subunit CasA
MNLLNEPWMPVRLRDGSRKWIAPHQITDPQIVAFDADRPDFNGALAQFTIGLLQTTTPIDSPISWRQLFERPPDAETLHGWFSPVATAFEFDGDGARFMQDRTLDANEGAVCEIDALLIESPGDSTLKKNIDHFIKRGQIPAICPDCSVTALLTLQINAPSGGAGHRTGLRGGGPLTTLIVTRQKNNLWQDLWLNVRERSAFLAQGGDSSKAAEHLKFPWLTEIGKIQSASGETAPIQVHPAHVYWATPRRIRFDMENVSSGECAICSRRSERLIRQYVTKNYGLNYKGAWDHPFSPYYETKEGWLPLHPQPGGFGYRHWLAWVMGLSSDKKKLRPARVVGHCLENRRRVVGGQLRLWAFGYDMDNMKARCWYESTLPLYGLAECEREAQRRVEAEVGVWLGGAEMAASCLRGAVKDAWFSGDARGDFGAIDAAFWSRTEAPFYEQLKRLIDAARDGHDYEAMPGREAWHELLSKTARDLFDNEFVGAGAIERQNPHRVAKAFQQLVRNLRGPAMRLALALPPLDPPKSKSKSTSARSTT